MHLVHDIRASFFVTADAGILLEIANKAAIVIVAIFLKFIIFPPFIIVKNFSYTILRLYGIMVLGFFVMFLFCL